MGSENYGYRGSDIMILDIDVYEPELWVQTYGRAHRPDLLIIDDHLNASITPAEIVAELYKVAGVIVDQPEKFTPIDLINTPGFGEVHELTRRDDGPDTYDITPLPDTRKNWQNKYEKQFGGKRKLK